MLKRKKKMELQSIEILKKLRRILNNRYSEVK